ncbi:MAG: carbohydrate ABC transporter permease [Chloroflexi bacterium]|nr:carbohydrate ABC transporter permease [Chloroflexota bacterium]MBV9596745.1 carbohydrate ABC transporter permease [Chloroflexota bacterium]
MEQPSTAAQIARLTLFIVLGVVMLFPFVYVIAVSFSSYKDVIGGGLILFPQHPSLEAYRTIFRGGIVTRALLVSVGLTVVGTAVNMVMTVTMAYGLTRPIPGSRFVLGLVLFTLLFSAGLIPNYLLVKQLGMLNSYASLILPGAISAFNLVVIRQFFMNLPQELLECARIDGANELWILLRVVLPLSKPVLAVIALFYGVAHWNDFFAATLYLNDADKWPIQLVLRQYVLQGSSLAAFITPDPNQAPPPPQTVQMAVVVVATLPILIVYPFLQRYFTQGVLSGAIKG